MVPVGLVDQEGQADLPGIQEIGRRAQTPLLRAGHWSGPDLRQPRQDLQADAQAHLERESRVPARSKLPVAARPPTAGVKAEVETTAPVQVDPPVPVHRACPPRPQRTLRLWMEQVCRVGVRQGTLRHRRTSPVCLPRCRLLLACPDEEVLPHQGPSRMRWDT